MAESSGRRSALRRALATILPSSRRARIVVVIVVAFILLALLDPFLSLLVRAGDFIAWVGGPVLGTPLGRLGFLNAAVALAGLLTLAALRRHVRELREASRLRHHRAALAALVRGDLPRARREFAAVTRGHPARDEALRFVADQARLGRARAELELGLPPATTLTLGEDAPTELRRSAEQLRARAAVRADRDPQHAREMVEAALARFPDDVVLLRLHRDLLASHGSGTAALAVQTRIAEAAPPAERATERRRLAQEHAALGRLHLQADPPDLPHAAECAARALAVDPRAAAPRILVGDLALARGELPAALRAWSEVGSEAAWKQVIHTLDASPIRFTIDDLLAAIPYEAALAILARDGLRRNRPAWAERAARVLQRRVGPTAAANALLDRSRRAVTNADATAATATQPLRLGS